MTGTLQVVRAAHTAFRRDIAAIDDAAHRAAQGQSGLEATVERFHFFNEVLSWHAAGEEAGIFPAMEQAAPAVVEAYEIDHRGLDVAFDGLAKAVTAHDPLGTARATAAFRFHLEMHLLKEEQHLFRLFEERLSPDEQARAAAAVGGAVPGDRFTEFVTWLFALVDHDDRERVVRTFRDVMAPPFFDATMTTVRAAVDDDGFAELTRRIPDLVP